MGTNTLDERSQGQPIDNTHPNAFRTALSGALVGRDSSGIPAAGQDLGTVTYPWGHARVGSLTVDGTLVDFSSLSVGSHKIISGKTRSTSNQPAFLTPAGTAGGAVVTLDATPTPLVIGRTWGEPEPDEMNSDGERNYIPVDTMGSEISALVGKYAAFQVGTEFFLAFVYSTTVLTNVRRGFFYDSALAPLNRFAITNNDTIYLRKATWLFADLDGTTVDKTTTPPFIDASTPGSPASGDYWFDLANQVWKRYNGSVFVEVDRIPIGIAVCNTADCVAARSFDFHAGYLADNSMELTVYSNSVAIGKRFGQRLSVAGNMIKFQTTHAYWDMATDLAGSADMYSATEQASRTYFFYIKDTGQEVISDISPYRDEDKLGWYHPHNPWRCVGAAQNDGSSHLSGSTIRQYSFHTWIRGEMLVKSIVLPTPRVRGFTPTDISEPFNFASSVLLLSNTFGITAGGVTFTQWSNNTFRMGNSATVRYPLVVSQGDNDSNGIIVRRGNVVSNAAGTEGDTFSIVHNSTGVYTVTYGTAFKAAEVPMVFFSAFNPGTSTAVGFELNSSSNTGFVMAIRAAGTLTNLDFKWVAFGEKAD